MTIETYRGKALDIHFDAHKCVHSRNCVLSLTRVFQANVEGPWIDPDGASAEEVAAAVRACPSGALTYTRQDAGAKERAPDVNCVRALENGPLMLHADIEILGAPAGTRAMLCRCGLSKNKPYCDHSHAEAGFLATGEPATKPEIAPLTARGGTLKITPQKNGSLRVEGNLEILSGTGRRVDLTTKAFLCRCGHSANKPYCDGTHNKIGFQAE